MAKLSDLPELLQTRQWKAAEKLLRREAAKPVAMANIFYNLAKVLEADGRHAQSGRWLEKAVAAKLDYAAAWFELGRWHLANHQLRPAFTAFGNASQLDPGDKDAKRNLARLALRLGEWEIARQVWSDFDDTEACCARYRIAAETGEQTAAQLQSLLKKASARPSALKAMTRTARGHIPLSLPETID